MSMLTPRIFYLVPVALIAIFLLFANNETRAIDCNALAADIDNRHNEVVQQHPRGSQERIKNLYDIEDSAFKVINQCPDNASVIAAMGDLQISLGQVPLAELYGKKAISLESSNWHAHYVLGSALNLQKKYAEGLQHLERASQLQPTNYSLVLNLCSSYERNGKYEQAIKTCTSVIEKGPYAIRGTAYFLRAQARKANGEPTLAEKDLSLAQEFGIQK